MSDEEYEEEVEVEQSEFPSWKFDPWNIAGIGLTSVGAIFGVLNQGLNMAANECWTHARWRKQMREAEEIAEWEAYQAELEQEARREMAESYEKLVGMDTLWLEQEADRITGEDES